MRDAKKIAMRADNKDEERENTRRDTLLLFTDVNFLCTAPHLLHAWNRPSHIIGPENRRTNNKTMLLDIKQCS